MSNTFKAGYPHYENKAGWLGMFRHAWRNTLRRTGGLNANRGHAADAANARAKLHGRSIEANEAREAFANGVLTFRATGIGSGRKSLRKYWGSLWLDALSNPKNTATGRRVIGRILKRLAGHDTYPAPSFAPPIGY